MLYQPLINTPQRAAMQVLCKRTFFFWVAVGVVSPIFLLSGCGSKGEQADASLPMHVQPGAPKLIKVSEKVAKQIDLRHEAIKKIPLTVPLHVTGKIEPDLGKEVDVSSRINGRVKSVNVAPGQQVVKGQVMAMLDSQEISDLQAELIEAQSKLNIARAHEDRERQVYDELLVRPKALVEARTRFNSATVHKELAESEYKRQEGLYKEKISAQKDFLTAKAGYATAVANYEQAKVDQEREKNFFKNKSMMRKDLQLAEAETAREKQHLRTLVQRLEFLGADKKMLGEVLAHGQISGIVRISSPDAGVVSHHDVAVGEVVHPDKSLFKVTDLATVVVKADLPEIDVSRVHLGGKVRVKLSSYPNEVFLATVSYISEHVNPETRTVAIRARLSNQKKIFKLQMFAEIDLEGASRDLLAVPKSAVQEMDGKPVVFVAKEGGYDPRHVKLGVDSDKYFEVVSGLEAGEEVVTQGSLMLRTELTYKH
ncbi:MAG: efflux RND transporter periplasmic adaptor subunit [Leptolyngbya sp.]|nr:efflux RND transporter periplasmic adaptor subunit [Candidatus Melainabacteria bacterium]